MPRKSLFTIVVDTREQRPWFQDTVLYVGGATKAISPITVRKKLDAGDYSIEGYETHIAIERKSMSDLIGSITRGRKRFVRELERLESYQWSAIFVEGEWKALMDYCEKYTSISPASLDGTITAFAQRYHWTHWVFRPGRGMTELAAYKALDRFHQDNYNSEEGNHAVEVH